MNNESKRHGAQNRCDDESDRRQHRLTVDAQRDSELAKVAKTIVVLAFRNGPLEELHAGLPCPTCQGESRYSRITNGEMKQIMKSAVDAVFKLLLLQRDESEKWRETLMFAADYTKAWDEPGRARHRRHRRRSAK